MMLYHPRAPRLPVREFDEATRTSEGREHAAAIYEDAGRRVTVWREQWRRRLLAQFILFSVGVATGLDLGWQVVTGICAAGILVTVFSAVQHWRHRRLYRQILDRWKRALELQERMSRSRKRLAAVGR